MKPTYSPKFVSTITALSLSLCTSNLTAHHPDNKWELLNLRKTNHSGDGSQAQHITTISPQGNSDSGMIKIKNNSSGTLTSLMIQNGKTINGANQIINVSNNRHISVPTITNKGILLGNTHNNVSNQGVIHIQNATITNFTNTGTINAKGGNAVMLKNATITTFINESLIETESQNSQNGNQVNPNHSAFLIQTGTTITSLHNKGTIKAKHSGINIASANTTITHLHNSGTIHIENNNGNDQHSAGIMLGSFNGGSNSTSYETIENSGTITGANYGIYLEGGNITNLKNSGNIDANKDGIGLHNANSNTNITIQNLDIDSGTIKGKENGINISKTGFSQNHQTIVENLNIKAGATVEGEKSGLVLGQANGNKQSNNGTYKLTGQINVQGTLKGATAITNHGELGSGDGKEVIVIGEQGKIEGVIKNESGGKLQGNITNHSSHALEIDNKGSVGNNTVITNNGQGEIKIKDWKLEGQGNGSTALKALKFEGNESGGKITLEKLTVNVQNANITNENLKAAFQGNKMADAIVGTQVVAGNDNGAVSFSGDLLRGLVANIDGSKTAAAALNRTLITTATARATFLDSVMGNALNTLYFL
ncbi:MAG: hypothetical protein MSA68_07905, partial [Helicobacter sp.]|nr:hypothetical protein [Helicobacter sp.]